MIFHACHQTPAGLIELSFTEDALIQCRTVPERTRPDAVTPLARAAFEQLDAYFAGKLRRFSLPVSLAGTGFQLDVWEALREIPYGQIMTYSQIARKIGRPGAARAVGGACGKNPLWIIIPCHRAVGAHGALGGYAGGIGMKKALLTLEQRFL